MFLIFSLCLNVLHTLLCWPKVKPTCNNSGLWEETTLNAPQHIYKSPRHQISAIYVGCTDIHVWILSICCQIQNSQAKKCQAIIITLHNRLKLFKSIGSNVIGFYFFLAASSHLKFWLWISLLMPVNTSLELIKSSTGMRLLSVKTVTCQNGSCQWLFSMCC